MLPRATLIVPCYNEERRLDRARFSALAEDPQVDLMFVDDGSKDGTSRVIREMAAAHPDKITAVTLPRNVGKGEAVRAGLQRALDSGAAIVGYADADLSTPPDELLRLHAHFEATRVQAVIGARVMLIGRHIERKRMRHYLGRIFASMAGAILRMPLYDTQCGAKLFRATPLFRKVVEMPFQSRWAFDVELLGRLIVGTSSDRGLEPGELIEVPLNEWVDVDGSKVSAAAMGKTLVDLARIELEMERLRAARKR